MLDRGVGVVEWGAVEFDPYSHSCGVKMEIMKGSVMYARMSKGTAPEQGWERE